LLAADLLIEPLGAHFNGIGFRIAWSSMVPDRGAQKTARFVWIFSHS
jgi:hypothetical protein